MKARLAVLLLVILGTGSLPASADSPKIRPYGNRVIAITFGNTFNISAGASTANYQVTGPASIAVTSIGRDSKIQTLIPTGWPYTPVMQHTVFLTLASAMQEKASYTVTVAAAVTGSAMSLPVMLDSTIVAGDLIKVNQCGYLPTSRKLAYLGGYLGDGGALSLTGLTGRYWLVDLQTQQNVFQGTATLSKSNDSESGENVYWMDFTSFTTPGKYAIQVEGIGRSYSFTIGGNAMTPALVTVARGLYHQRCGIALVAPYTTFTHPACHRGLTKLVTVYDSMDDIMSSLPNYVDPSGKLIDGWGGWHDAGDYDRLGSRHRQVVCDLLDAYECNPGKFSDGQLNIPESGNGIPDILDEAKWGLDWFERVFDATDGGFYYRIDGTNYGSTMPQLDTQQLYCMAKYPYYSTWAGQCFAQASRVFRPFNSTLADHYLSIARSALAYGQAQLAKGSDTTRLKQAVGTLAAEIYVTSGDSSAQSTFLKYSFRGVLGYAMCTRSDINQTAKTAAKNYFTNAAVSLLNAKHASGYVTCFSDGVSAGDTAMFQAATLLRGYRTSGRSDILEAALLSLDHHLGANPLGYCWITGTGTHYPMQILQVPSENDGIAEPVPGIPIFGAKGPSAIAGSTHGDLFNQDIYPASGYPYLRYYSELPDVVGFSEFTIASQSSAVLAYSFFAGDAPKGQVLGCHVFYNNSAFDGKGSAANAADDAAIAVDKTPLLPGGTATFANYTGYVGGINGIMVDIAGAPGNVSLSDFSFKAGNSNTPDSWAQASPPPSLAVRKGAGANGSDRITLTWPDGAIKNTWLQITVKATDATGLTADKVYYFGNAIGETGNSSSSARVDSNDQAQVRQDPHKNFANPAPITDPCDFNRDGKVDTVDAVIARGNTTTVVTELKLIAVP